MQLITRPAPTHASTLSLEGALALGEPAWESLRASSSWTAPFTSWAWHDAWSASAPRAERESALAVVAFGEDGRLDALLPLAQRRVRHRRVEATALIWAVDDEGAPDHLDVLARPDAPLDDVASALDALEWDLLRLDGLASGAAGVERLRTALGARGIVTSLRAQWPCPYLDLPATWSEYLETRSRARRGVIARRERVLAEKVRTAVHVHDADDLDEGWRTFLALHDARWNGAGAFSPRLRALHRRFAAHMARRHRLWLVTLELDGRAGASWYGFDDGETLYFYQAGRAPEWHAYSVGGVVVGTMIQRAIAFGLRRFDFLRGDEPYKAEWTDSVRWTSQLVAYRDTARGRLARLADGAAGLRERVLANGGDGRARGSPP